MDGVFLAFVFTIATHFIYRPKAKKPIHTHSSSLHQIHQEPLEKDSKSTQVTFRMQNKISLKKEMHLILPYIKILFFVYILHKVTRESQIFAGERKVKKKLKNARYMQIVLVSY